MFHCLLRRQHGQGDTERVSKFILHKEMLRKMRGIELLIAHLYLIRFQILSRYCLLISCLTLTL